MGFKITGDDCESLVWGIRVGIEQIKKTWCTKNTKDKVNITAFQRFKGIAEGTIRIVPVLSTVYEIIKIASLMAIDVVINLIWKQSKAGDPLPTMPPAEVVLCSDDLDEDDQLPI